MAMVTLMAAIMMAAAFAPPAAAEENSGKLMHNWIATGIVTRVDNHFLYMLAKDNVIYRIDTGNSVFRSEGLAAQPVALGVGDRVQVSGKQTAATVVEAREVLVYGPPQPTVQPEPWPMGSLQEPAFPAGPGAGPTPGVLAQLEPPLQLDPIEAIWSSRGLIAGISFHDSTLTLQTSRGVFKVEARGASVNDGRRMMVFSDLSRGDAVRILGDVIGVSRIRADQIVLLKLRSDVDGQLPVRPAVMRGKILNIDYPSYTFRMETGQMPVNVLVDENTTITMHGNIMAFMNLQPGATVKIDGLGSPAAGYVAQNIVIVSVPPR